MSIMCIFNHGLGLRVSEDIKAEDLTDKMVATIRRVWAASLNSAR